MTSGAASGASLKERIDRLKADLTSNPVNIADFDSLPFAIFHYHPTEEFLLRQELDRMQGELLHADRQMQRISLADLMWQAIDCWYPGDGLFDAEREQGLGDTVLTIHNVLTNPDLSPLVESLKERLAPMDPAREVAFLVRTGSLFPVYRTSALLENLAGVTVPTVLCYPGRLEGAKGLSFMGVYEADPNYRPRIY